MDAIIFKVEVNKNKEGGKPYRKHSPFFESLTEKEISSNITQVTLKWIDSTKFKDKMVKRESKIVQGLLFEEYSKLIVFSESESETSYFIIRAQEKYSFKVSEVLLYDDFSKGFLSNKWKDTEIIAFNLKNEFGEEFILNTKGRCFQLKNELTDILAEKENNIISITFKFGKNFYFSMDKRSVISVPDNLTQAETISLYKELVKVYG